jgi:hypothetical protein
MIIDLRRARRLSSALFIAFLALTANAASADKRRARVLDELARKEYTLGRFQEAVVFYQQAYEEHPDPAFLFNLAQCHRQLDDCARAAFYYRLYLSEEPRTRARAEIEGRVREMEARCAEREAAAPITPKTQTTSVAVSAKLEAPTATVAAPRHAPAPAISNAVSSGAEHLNEPWIGLGVQVGLVLLPFEVIDVPPQPLARVAVRFPLWPGALSLEPRVSFAITPIAYEVDHRGDRHEGTATLLSPSAGVEASYAVAGDLRIGLELHAGAEIFTGLDRRNPFTRNFGGVPAAPLVLGLRGGVTIGYEVSEGLQVDVAPATVAWAAEHEVVSEIAGHIRFEVAAGVSFSP